MGWLALVMTFVGFNTSISMKNGVTSAVDEANIMYFQPQQKFESRKHPVEIDAQVKGFRNI